MNRRSAIAGAFALVAIAGCQTGASTRTQLQTISGLATGGIDAVAAVVLSKPNLAPDARDKITSAQATVDAANAEIQRVTTTIPSNAQALALAIQIAKPVLLAQVPAGSDEALAVTAAFALLPTILAAAGLPPAPAAAMVASKTMDPATAKLILQGYTRK